MLRAGQQLTAHETVKRATPSMLSEGVPFQGVPNGSHYVYSTGVGTGGLAKR